MTETGQYTETLVDYAYGLTFESLPESARHDCKRLILDILGIALRGSKTAHGRIAAEFAGEFNDKKEASVIAFGYRTSSLNAAFANGVMAHAIDFDDTHRNGTIHIGCACIPAALATGEVQGISGRELMAAVAAAYDVSARVGASVPSHHTPLGFHTTGTANCFGAAAAAGKVMRLSKEQLRNAFGIAGTQAAGLRQFNRDGTMTKHFNAGKAAQNGVFAALLAKKGFTGPPQILEGEWGFCRVLSGDDFDLEKLTLGLGENFAVSETGIKPYASCRATHGPIDAALSLQRTHNLDPAEMDTLTLRVYDKVFMGQNKPSPATWLEAILSLQYCVATALVKRGPVFVDDFTAEKLQDSQVRGLMKRMNVLEDGELTRMSRETPTWPAELEILMTNGNKLSERVDYPLGEPSNPVSDSFLIDKFRALAGSVLGGARVKGLQNSIMKLEQVENVRDVVEMLCPEKIHG